MKTTTKKRVGTLGLVFALCLSTLATFSFFTDREQQTTGGTAGTFDLVFEDISASKSGDNGIQSQNEFAIDQVWENKSLVSEGGVLNPGDFFDLSYTIANEGSKSMDVKQLLTLNSTVELTEGAEEYKLTISRAGVTETITGTLADDKMSISYEIPEIILNGSVEIEDGVDITEQTYIVRLDFDLMAENTFQSSVVTINYNAQAKQHRNTDASHWTNWADLETGVEQFAKPQLSKPEVSLDGDTLTITPVENATGYEIYNGGTLLTTTTETSVDLSGLISDPGTYTVKVRATGSSDYMPSGYAKAEYVRELTPGLYETGTNYTVLIMSWDDMVSDGTITVEGSTVSAVPSASSLSGDLLIADGVTAFGTVFASNEAITGLTIPEGVTSISAGAFQDSINLTHVNIPASVTSIGTVAFKSCSSLTSLTVASGNTVYHSDGNCIIETASKTLVAGCKNSVIPADGSVTAIGSSAFSGCKNLRSLEIPASVTTIEGGATYYAAFSYCRSLANVTFAEGSKLTTIGASAFYNCTSLKSIEIPASVTTIGNDAFSYCRSLANVTFAEGSKLTTIGNDAFYYCTSLATVTFGEDSQLTTIGDSAFSNCTALTSIELPETLNTIETYAFSGCNALMSIEIPASVTSINEGVFKNCTSLTSVNIPASVKSVSTQAFYYCTGLQTVTFEGTPSSINSSAFNFCTALATINVPWAEGTVADAPWGATSATINYNYTAG